MNEDKAYVLRKSLIVIALILIFATAGLITIASQVKTVTLDYYGDIKSIKTLSQTIDSFILQNKIYVGDNTQVSPSRNEKIVNGMEIKITSKSELAKIDDTKMKQDYKPMIAKVEEVIETIPFEEETKNNSTLARGTQNVIQEGKEGQKVTQYLVKYNAEEEVCRVELASNVTSEAQNKVIEVGTKLNSIASRSASVNIPNSITTDGGFKQYNIKLPVEQQKYAYNLCKQYGLSYELFLAVMYKESGYNPYAVGGGNSYGLCQIHVSNHANLRAKLGISDFYNPYDNMKAGAYLLSHYFAAARARVSGSAVEVYALNSYNMGEGAYFNNCYSKGVLNRAYSNSIIALKNRLITNGGL